METQPRRLEALHPSFRAQYDGTKWVGLTPYGETGWSVIDGAVSILSHETQIDLSGYAMDSLTFFPRAVGIQDPGIYTFKNTAGDTTVDSLQVLDIVTTVPMDINRVSNAMIANVAPGMIDSDYDFTPILFGLFRFFTSNTQISYPDYMQLERSQRFDSGEATAADKLYCYRIVQVIATEINNQTEIFIPAARQLLGGMLGEESDLVYMQRLKRSYELANQI
jgi:hypothetical protein